MIKKHSERIKWRISNGGWKANQTDLDALNGIIEYANKEEERNFMSNQHFAKMYIYIYGEFLRYYDCTVYESQPEKAIQHILKADLGTLLDNLTYTINEKSLSAELRDNGFVFAHPKTLSKEQKEKNIEALKNAKGDRFTSDVILENLTAMIKNALRF